MNLCLVLFVTFFSINTYCHHMCIINSTSVQFHLNFTLSDIYLPRYLFLKTMNNDVNVEVFPKKTKSNKERNYSVSSAYKIANFIPDK